MKQLTIAALGAAIAVCAAGCADWGATEPVLNGGNYTSSPYSAPYSAPAAPSTNFAADNAVATRSNRDIADVRADMDVMREEQKRLLARIEGLEQDNLRKDEQIKTLQTLLDAMDKRFADVDKGWQGRMAELSTTIDREREARKQEMATYTKTIINELDAKQPAPQAEQKYKIFMVQRGDTLSAIAAAAGVSVAEIKKLNNMKKDSIYENQKLKIPVK